MKMIQTPGKCGRWKNTNAPAHFIQKIAITSDDKVTDKAMYDVDKERIKEESMYDVFYAVVTNLEDASSEVIRINK